MAQTYTFSQCIELLDVDAKVFRRWVREDLGLGEKDQVSRADSRVRYLSRGQLEKLAELHDKTLPVDDQVASDDDDAPPGAYKLLADRVEALENLMTEVRNTLSAYAGDATYNESQLGHLRELFEHPESGVYARMEALDHHLSDIEVHMQPPVPDATQQIAGIEARYKQRITELEQELATYKQTRLPTPSLSKKRATKKRRHSTIKTLPKSLVARNAFATLHNISEKQVSKEALAGRIATTEGKWLSNEYVVTRALNEKGKRDFYEVFHQRSGFQACDQCPHDVIDIKDAAASPDH